MQVGVDERQTFQRLFANLGTHEILLKLCRITLQSPNELPRSELRALFDKHDLDESGSFNTTVELQSIARVLLERVGVEDVDVYLDQIELQEGDAWEFEQFYEW